MVTKQILNQYNDLVKEQTEVIDKIAKLEKQIPKLEQRIREIEAGETVKDRVYGGDGGRQGFNIEGIPSVEYDHKKAELLRKKLLYEERKTRLKLLRIKIAETINEVEEFISSIDDSHIRRIINLRYVKGLPWNIVAMQIGGMNSEDSVRKALDRYLEKI